MIFLQNRSRCARRQKHFFRPLGFDQFFPRVYSMIWCEKNVDFSQFTPLRLRRFFSSKIFIVRLSSMDAMLECEFYTKGNISLCRRSPYDTTPPPCELYLYSADAIAGRRAHSDLLLRISYGKQPVSGIKMKAFETSLDKKRRFHELLSIFQVEKFCNF